MGKEELAAWERDYDLFGVTGLKAKRQPPQLRPRPRLRRSRPRAANYKSDAWYRAQGSAEGGERSFADAGLVGRRAFWNEAFANRVGPPRFPGLSRVRGFTSDRMGCRVASGTSEPYHGER